MENIDQPPTAQSGPSASLHARAEALYIAFTDNHPTIHCNRFAAWRELSNAAKREWMDKAEKADDRPPAGEKERVTPPAGARDAVTDDLIQRLNFEATALIVTKGREPESSDVRLLREAARALASKADGGES